MRLLITIVVLHLSFVFSLIPPRSDHLFAQILAARFVNVTAPTPQQIHVSYAGKDQMLVQWVSDSPNDPSTVQYGTSPSVFNSTQSGTVTSYTYEGYTSGGLHAVLLSGLSTDTVYYYKVGGPSQWSNAYFFKTPPALGTENVQIGAMGDVGADPNSAMTIGGLQKIRSAEGLDFVIHAGDLSYASNYSPGGPVWDHYGTILEGLAAYTPYQPSVGNHESTDKFTGFLLRFGIETLVKNSGGGKFYWSIDWGNVHVIFLSSETDYSTTSDQYSWLSKDLDKIDRKMTPWVIATWHRPWYCSNVAHTNEGEEMRKSFEPLFNKYKVDIGFAGHVHAYERVAEIYNFTMESGKTAYVTIGNGGTPEGLASKWHDVPAWSQYRVSKWGYSKLHIYNATHAYWRMWGDSDGALLDDHWFVKPYPR